MMRSVVGLMALLCVQQFAPAQEKFAWPEGKRVAVSLSFDDARASQVTAGLDLFERHGAKVTFYVNPRNMERQLAGWKRAVAQGHEIGNHSDTHPCSGNFPWSRKNSLEESSLAELAADIEAGGKGIERLLGVRPATFAYPCGSKFIGRGERTQSYVPLIARRYRAGRGFRDTAPNDPAWCDLAQLFGVDSDAMTFEQMRELVRKGEEQGGWVVFAGHEIGPAGYQTTLAAELDKLLEYAKDPANGVWLETVERIAAYVEKQRASGSGPSGGGGPPRRRN